MKMKICAHGLTGSCRTSSTKRTAGSPASFRSARQGRPCSAAAFTLVETVVATLVAGIVLPTLFAGLAFGFSSLTVSRENLRATQIILQKMEAIRLSPYKTLKDPTAYPASYTEYYSESGKTNGTGGAAYKMTYSWVPGGTTLPPAYRSNMVQVTVTASWNSGNIQRSHSMQTWVARYGIQRYVSGN